MLPFPMAEINDTPEFVFRPYLRGCAAIHTLSPQLDLVCVNLGDTRCLRAVVDRYPGIVRLLLGAVDTPAEQA